MTTTIPATETSRSCRCGATIILAGRSWIVTDETGRVDFHCPDGSIHKPGGCPPSAVHDVIVTWTDSDGALNVGAGDLILHAGRLDIVTRAETGLLPNGDACVHVSVAGSWLPCCFPAENLVAVRRYDTGEV